MVSMFDRDTLERKFMGKDVTGPEGREGHA